MFSYVSEYGCKSVFIPFKRVVVRVYLMCGVCQFMVERMLRRVWN
jgi:hypothetical protein